MTAQGLDFAEFDPGIRRTVAWCRRNGFETTDSGDGVTKVEMIAEGCAMAIPHVFMRVSRETMAAEADRLWSLIPASARSLDDNGAPVVLVEASYHPDSGAAVLSLLGLSDDHLAERDQ